MDRRPRNKLFALLVFLAVPRKMDLKSCRMDFELRREIGLKGKRTSLATMLISILIMVLVSVVNPSQIHNRQK
jgi:hypothetical protein